MKKFLIKCDTNWCGEDVTYRAEANSEEELYDIAEQLAYENFESYDRWYDIAQDQEYDPDEMTDKEWDDLYNNVDESEYYNYVIEPFEGDDEEWEQYGEEIYNSKPFA